MNISNLIGWAKSKEGRYVNVVIDNYVESNPKFNIYVHDYILGVGQFVDSVDEVIDLEAKKKAQDLEKFEQLKKQFA